MVSRTTAFNFDSTGKSAQDIGAELGVRYLVWERNSRPKAAFLQPKPEFMAHFKEIERNFDGFRIFVRRGSEPTR